MAKSLKKNAFLNFVKCFMNIIFPIISFPYASRVLMPQGIGQVNFANAIIDYFLLIAGLGVSTYGAREAAKIRDDQFALDKFVRELFCINLLSTAFAYGLFVLVWLFSARLAYYRVLLLICATKILFTTAGINWLFVAMEDYAYTTIRSIFFQILSLVFLFLFVRDSGDVYQYAAMGVLSNVGGNIFNFFYGRRYVNFFRKTKLELRKHLKPIFLFFSIDCADKMNSTLDSVMLGFMLGDVSVGLYSVANKLTKMVVELITAAISTFMPRSSYYLENKKLDEYSSMVSKAFGAAVFFVIPAALGLAFLCKPLIVLFSGEQYLGASTAMEVLSIGMIGHCMNSFLNNLIIIPQRKERFTFIARLVAASFNILGNYFFIKRWGVFGAALATMVVEFILPAVVLIPSWTFVRTKTNFVSLLQVLLGSGAMWLVLQVVFGSMESVVLKTVGSVFLGSAVYAMVELALRNKTAWMIIGIARKRIRH